MAFDDDIAAAIERDSGASTCHFPFEETVRAVIWNETTWWCELGLVQGYPVLRLYDADALELEHEIMPGTISAAAEAMRQAVLRHLSGDASRHSAR